MVGVAATTRNNDLLVGHLLNNNPAMGIHRTNRPMGHNLHSERTNLEKENTPMTYQLLHGNCLDILKTLPDNSIDAIVTDPPYELGFMGKKWDASGIAYNVEMWEQCLRVLKHGGHLLAFGGTRTYHRMACAIEDAGFEIRDSIHWLYGSGFPKSLDVSKAIDKAAGADREIVGKHPNPGSVKPRIAMGERWKAEPDITAPATDAAKQWEGWGTALKPAHEPVVVARKPLDGTVANNVLQHGTGALNIDATRANERWPANLIIDETIAEQHPEWANYFYCPKPSKRERNAGLDDLPNKLGGSLEGGNDKRKGDKPQLQLTKNFHPTVKPLALMQYLIRLVTPPDGTVLDPFAGSGTTLAAAILENKNAIGIELTDDYLPIIEARCQWATEQKQQQTDQQPTLFDESTPR
jgi:site-specific DNA-methyltransferase (adenine-specific)